VSKGRFFDLHSAVDRMREELQSLEPEDIMRRGQGLLEDSVRSRLIADVPVGAFLSGGLDSSLIVSLIRGACGRSQDFRTFSVGFRNDTNSELPFARQVARHLKTHHTEVHLDEDDYVSKFAHLTARRDAPLSEPADLAVAKMSAVAKESVKVVLSGEGADEVFCGYPKYWLVRAPWLLRYSVRVLGATRAARLAQCLGVERRRALIAAKALAMPSELERLSSWFTYLDRSTLRVLLPGLGWSEGEWEQTMADQAAVLMQNWRDPVVRMQAVDCLTWLPENLLQRGDRMTMAVGLELRVPFLAKDLVAFGLALESSMKIRGRSLKHIVRRWSDRRVPEMVLRRPKWGFRVPLGSWFRAGMRDMVFDYLTSDRGICGTYGDRRRIGRLLKDHDRNGTDASLELWTLLTNEVWYQDVFLAGRGRSAHA
jgi:asparagine synthase (glutamine-hydrolysing)